MNKKKVIIAILIFLLLVIGILVGLYLHNIYCKSTTISSIDNTFSITVPNKVRYKVKESSDENYSLEFYSVKDEMFFYSTVINKKYDLDLENNVRTEKENIIKNLSSVNIISDVSRINIKDYNSYKYSYTYKDESFGKDLYAEIVWIETNSKIYILDLEVITENMDKYKTIFEQIQNSFIEN